MLGSIERCRQDLERATEQDGEILAHLADYIGFCGYRLFRGFDFRTLRPHPGLRALALWRHGLIARALAFQRLGVPPTPGLRVLALWRHGLVARALAFQRLGVPLTLGPGISPR